jgi:hypothetical protein
MHSLLEELALRVHAGILSAVQLDIIVKRTCDCGKSSWDRLVAHVRLSRPNVLIRAFIRIAWGRFWAPGMPGRLARSAGRLAICHGTPTWRSPSIQSFSQVRRDWTPSDCCNSDVMYRLEVGPTSIWKTCETGFGMRRWRTEDKSGCSRWFFAKLHLAPGWRSGSEPQKSFIFLLKTIAFVSRSSAWNLTLTIAVRLLADHFTQGYSNIFSTSRS